MEKYKIYYWKRTPIQLFREIKKENKERLRDYMHIYVCKDYKEMYELSDKLEGNKIKRDYGARTMNYIKRWYDYESGEYVKTSPNCGYILFCEEYLTYETIAHECSHAVIGYFGRQLNKYGNSFIRVIDVKENNLESNDADLIEELYCYMHGGLVNQILEILTKRE